MLKLQARIVVLGVILLTFALQGAAQRIDADTKIDVASLPTPFCFRKFCSPDANNYWEGASTTALYRRGNEHVTDRELSAEGRVYGIYFRDSDRGWIVGGGGMIYHTPDGGKTWVRQQSSVEGEEETLNAITCVDDQRCWAVGQESVLQTTDAGRHWRRLTNISAETSLFQAVSFVDAQTGWIAAHENEVLHTSDGGASWQVQKVGTDDDALDFLEDVKFVNRQTGYVTGWGGVARTTDGGTTWQTVLRESETEGNGHFIGLVVRDGGRKVWAVGDERTPNYCSEDSGRSWKPCGLKARDVKKAARRC